MVASRFQRLAPASDSHRESSQELHQKPRSVAPAVEGLAALISALGEIPGSLAAVERRLRDLASAVNDLEARLPPQLVTVRDASKTLGCSVATIRRKVAQGELPSVRIGRTVRLDLSKVRALGGDDVAALLQQRRGPIRAKEK
jgi:excisionase family DNA binding protein